MPDLTNRIVNYNSHPNKHEDSNHPLAVVSTELAGYPTHQEETVLFARPLTTCLLLLLYCNALYRDLPVSLGQSCPVDVLLEHIPFEEHAVLNGIQEMGGHFAIHILSDAPLDLSLFDKALKEGPKLGVNTDYFLLMPGFASGKLGGQRHEPYAEVPAPICKFCRYFVELPVLHDEIAFRAAYLHNNTIDGNPFVFVEYRVQQFILAFKMPVEGAFGYVHGVGDLLDRGSLETFPNKKLNGLLDYLVPDVLCCLVLHSHS